MGRLKEARDVYLKHYSNCILLSEKCHAGCNCLSQWAYTGQIYLIILYFQHQEIASIGKYRFSLNIISVGNYFVGLFLVYACVW